MDKVLISVIVPVYKVEKYLNRCIESIVNQTYKNLEIILVDDGSPDNCPQICDEWSNKDKRIKVIHKENGGLSDARNAGLDIACGRYVSFVDSDDFIDKTMLEKLLNNAIKNNSDIVKCEYSIINEDNDIIEVKEINLHNITPQNVFKLYLNDETSAKDDKIISKSIGLNVWTSLYSRVAIGDKRFIKGMFAEDFIFNCSVICEDTKMSAVQENLYYYFIRNGSIMNSFNEDKIKKRLNFIDTAIDNVKTKLSDNDFKAFKFLMFKQIMLDMLHCDKNIYKKYKSEIKRRNLNTRENYRKYKGNKVSFKKRIFNYLIHKEMVGTLKILIKR